MKYLEPGPRMRFFVAQSLTLRMGMVILVVVSRCAEQHPRVLVRLQRPSSDVAVNEASPSEKRRRDQFTVTRIVGTVAPE